MKLADRLRAVLKKPVIIYPLLFAVFPILFLYAYNISEMSLNLILLFLLASVLLALVLWILLSLILRSTFKGALAAGLFLFLFFFYGRFYELLEKWDVWVPRHAVLLPGALLLWGYCVYFIRIAGRDFKTAAKVLNIMTAFLVLVNLFNIGYFQFTSPKPSAAGAVSVKSATANTALAAMPDIYHIILDEYANSDTMRDIYGYDNNSFEAALAARGFFIAHKSVTESSMTHRAIASVLNMEYLPDSENHEIFYEKIRKNKVVSYLEEIGYRPILVGYDLTPNFNKSWGMDDPQLLTGGSGASVEEFRRVLLNTTLLRPFYNRLTGEHYRGFYQRGTLDSLQQLSNMPGIKGPKYVFAYFLCPHEPFVFGPEGEPVSPANFFNYKDDRYYLGQYIFITREIEKVVDTLMKKSARKPIIIIQSDHGIRWTDQWQKIFNACYLPGNTGKSLYDNISPVNTYPFIFNHYFKANIAFVPDVSEETANIYLANRKFEYWGQGPGPFTSSKGNTSTADRWSQNIQGSASFTTIRGPSEEGSGSARVARVAFTSSGGTGDFTQDLSDYSANLAGQDISFDIKVKTTAAGGVSAFIWTDAGGYVLGTPHSGSGEYETLNVTAKLPPGAGSVWVGVRFTESAEAYIGAAILVQQKGAEFNKQ